LGVLVAFVFEDALFEVCCDADVDLLEAVGEDVDVGVLGHVVFPGKQADGEIQGSFTSFRMTAWNRQRQQQQQNTGVLHFVQDDGVEQATATATANATANTGVLHFVQDDGVEHGNGKSNGNATAKYRGPSLREG